MEPALGGPLREALSCTESGEPLARFIDTRRSFEPDPNACAEEDRRAQRFAAKIRDMDEATLRLLPKHIAEPWHPSR